MLETSAGRVVVALAVLALATAIGLLLRSRNGRLRRVSGQAPTLRDVLGPPGGTVPTSPSEATVVQISSAVCAPCRATARTWHRVAGVENHVEIDIEQRPDVAALLSVWRTPTSFVFDSRGALVSRIDGAPDRDRAALAYQDAQSTTHPTATPDTGAPR